MDLPRSPVLSEVVQCRALADAGERLACYDRAVAALDTAERNKEVIVTDREAVKEARQSLFGLQLPAFRLFSDSGEEEPQEVEGEVASARRTADGRWLVTLADGARWQQTEARTLARDPRAGMKVRIRKAALGSYLANIDGQNAVRVRRVN